MQVETCIEEKKIELKYQEIHLLYQTTNTVISHVKVHNYKPPPNIYSTYKPPPDISPPFISPPKTPCEVI